MTPPTNLFLQFLSGLCLTEWIAPRRSLISKSFAVKLVLVVLASAFVGFSPETLSAQTSGSTQTPATEPDGITSGGYQIHSSVELGGRAVGLSGSGDMYDTLVNLQSGPRFLDETLSMRSLDHQGLLFDDLDLNSFGWEGNPTTPCGFARTRTNGITCRAVFVATSISLITICWRIP